MHARSTSAATPARSPAAPTAADFAFDPALDPASDLASLRTLPGTLLRSFGQIVLQPNACTGACLLAAWLLAEPRLACAALCGAIAANLGAVLAGYPADDMRAGLHGFNGALAGLAAAHFIADNATATAVAILAATATAWLLRPWSHWLQHRKLAVYSSPCLLVTAAWLGFVHPAAAPAPVSAALSASSAISFVPFIRGVLASLAQTGFASGALTGGIVLLGIAAASRRQAGWALVGAGLATLAHLLIGASPASLDAGLLGCNGALTALALAERRLPAKLGGVLLSVALQYAAARFSVPAMTAPFVLATWGAQWWDDRHA